MKKVITFALLAGVLVTSCNTLKEKGNSKKVSHSNELPAPDIVRSEEHPVSGVMAPASAVVYKTRKDYYHNVPVTLSEDKSRIISYPAITDVYYNGKLAYPTLLNDGYLLDNRGINKDVAFLSYTYEAYANLKGTPSKDELFNSIVDKDPLVEIIDCGQRTSFTDEVEELNTLIERGFIK